MKLTRRCSCANFERAQFWTKTTGRVKVTVDTRGTVDHHSLLEMDTPTADNVFYCVWCGEQADVEGTTK